MLAHYLPASKIRGEARPAGCEHQSAAALLNKFCSLHFLKSAQFESNEVWGKNDSRALHDRGCGACGIDDRAPHPAMDHTGAPLSALRCPQACGWRALVVSR